MAFTAEQRKKIKARLLREQDLRGVATIEPVTPATSYEAEYYRVISRPVDDMSEIVRKEIYPILDRPQVDYGTSGFFNADIETTKLIRAALKSLEKYSQGFDLFAYQSAQRFTRKNDDYHFRKFVGAINKQFGVDISSVMSEAGIKERITQTMKENVRLIVDLPAKQYTRISNVIYSGLSGGDELSSIRKSLEKIDGIDKRRAKLIAIDQTQKFMGDLNRIRQENEGIDRYVWQTNIDGRERDRHRENDGEIFSWSDTSPGKAYGPPGYEIRCRCSGRGIIEESFLDGYRTPEILIPPKVLTRTIRPKAPTYTGPVFESPEFRNTVTKAERKIANNKMETAIVWDSKGNQILRKRGGRDYVNFTYAEAEKMKGAVLTHNHPSGSSFSPADITLFAQDQLAEVRATGSEYTYYLRGKIPKSKSLEITRAAERVTKETVSETYEYLRARYKEDPSIRFEVEGPKYDKELRHSKYKEMFKKYKLEYGRDKTNG